MERIVITADDISSIMPTYVEDDRDALDDVRNFGVRNGADSKYKPMIDKMIELANDPDRMIISFTVSDNHKRARIAQALREIAKRKKISVTVYNVNKRIDIVHRAGIYGQPKAKRRECEKKKDRLDPNHGIVF